MKRSEVGTGNKAGQWLTYIYFKYYPYCASSEERVIITLRLQENPFIHSGNLSSAALYSYSLFRLSPRRFIKYFNVQSRKERGTRNSCAPSSRILGLPSFAKFINTPDNKNRESKRKNKLYIIYFVTLPATISNYSFKEPGSPPRDSSHEDSRVSRDYCPIIQVSLNRFVWQNWLQFRNGPFPVNSSWIRKPQRTFTTLDD